MSRYAPLSVASVVSLLLVAGCSASGPRYHDKQTCETFASAVSVVESSNRTILWHSAVTQGRKAVRRPGYLSPRLARDLRVLTSPTSPDLDIRSALQAFAADCLVAGVKGPVYLTYVGSEG
jgi:hypothetical protein